MLLKPRGGGGPDQIPDPGPVLNAIHMFFRQFKNILLLFVGAFKVVVQG